MDKILAEMAIKEIAQEKNLSIDEIRGEMQNAINIAMQNPTPEIKEYWAKMCPDGSTPTPEDVIASIVDKIKNK